MTRRLEHCVEGYDTASPEGKRTKWAARRTTFTAKTPSTPSTTNDGGWVTAQQDAISCLAVAVLGDPAVLGALAVNVVAGRERLLQGDVPFVL